MPTSQWRCSGDFPTREKPAPPCGVARQTHEERRRKTAPERERPVQFLACRHLTRLDTLAALDLIKPKVTFDIGFQELSSVVRNTSARFSTGSATTGCPSCASTSTRRMLIRMRRPHESRSIAERTSSIRGRCSANLLSRASGSLGGQISWFNRIGSPGAVPSGSTPQYEVVDAKLARSAKARAVLQTAFYSSLLAQCRVSTTLDASRPRATASIASFRVADFSAYERRIRRQLEEFRRPRTSYQYPVGDPYPEPVEHCAICRWRPTAASGAAPTTTCRWWPACRRPSASPSKGAGVHAAASLPHSTQLPR